MEAVVSAINMSVLLGNDTGQQGDNDTYTVTGQTGEDNSTRDWSMELIGYGILVPSISLIGIVFNVINLIVLASPKLAESTYTYLTGLAVADLLSLVFFGLNSIGRGFYPNNFGWRVFEVYLYWPIGSITTVASVFLTVTVTIERFIFIYLPHRARSWCAPRIARWVSLILWILCLIVNIPRVFVFKNQDGQLVYTTFYKSPFYKVYSWLNLLVISFGSAILLIVFNILLIRGIHRTHKRRQGMTSRSQRSSASHQKNDETRLTKTLIGVIFLFIIGEIPSAMTSRSIVVNIIGQGDQSLLETTPYKISVLVATILVVGQQSLNFIIYCVFNRKFWAVFRKRLCPCIPQKTQNKNGTLLATSVMDSSPPRKTDASCHTAWASDVDGIALESVVSNAEDSDKSKTSEDASKCDVLNENV